jgi:hypothetical protein
MLPGNFYARHETHCTRMPHRFSHSDHVRQHVSITQSVSVERERELADLAIDLDLIRSESLRNDVHGTTSHTRYLAHLK